MKTLLIMRHGKAQPDAPSEDKARNLVERGERESESMGVMIRELGIRVDGVVSSDASRARQTAEIASAAAGIVGEITFEPDLYGAGLDILMMIVCGLPEALDCVLLVGHNPGFEDLSAALSAQRTEPPRLPTAALAHLTFDRASHWRDVREGTGRLVAVYTPKELR